MAERIHPFHLNFREKAPEGRPHLGLYTPQIVSFSPILRQKAVVGVSLTMAFLLVLRKNLSFWGAAQFWATDFSSQELPAAAAILAYGKADGNFCGGKDLSKTV